MEVVPYIQSNERGKGPLQNKRLEKRGHSKKITVPAKLYQGK